MKSINLKNPRLETLLLPTIDLFYSEDVKKISKRCKERKDDLILDYHPTSDEYLFAAFKMNLREFGYPRAILGCGSTEMNILDPNNKAVLSIAKINQRIGRHLGIRNQALSMYYPENGYIGWHHNGNAPGYNILLTYSLDGEGGFSFWDYKTESIKTIPDKVGWNAKVGYYPSERKEPNRVYWHMAKTKSPRVSLAWVIDQKDMWKNMIDEITGGDYDHDDILGQ